MILNEGFSYQILNRFPGNFLCMANVGCVNKATPWILHCNLSKQLSENTEQCTISALTCLFLIWRNKEWFESSVTVELKLHCSLHCRISERGPRHDPDLCQASNNVGDSPVARDFATHVFSASKILKKPQYCIKYQWHLNIVYKERWSLSICSLCSCVGSIMLSDRVMTRENIFPNLEMYWILSIFQTQFFPHI